MIHAHDHLWQISLHRPEHIHHTRTFEIQHTLSLYLVSFHRTISDSMTPHAIATRKRSAGRRSTTSRCRSLPRVIVIGVDFSSADGPRRDADVAVGTTADGGPSDHLLGEDGGRWGLGRRPYRRIERAHRRRSNTSRDGSLFFLLLAIVVSPNE